MEAHIIEGGVIHDTVILHLGLDATDSSIIALLAPGAKLAPVHAGPVQLYIAAAAEPDVVSGRVVNKNTPMLIDTKLESGECAGGAELNTGPLTKAAEKNRNT